MAAGVRCGALTVLLCAFVGAQVRAASISTVVVTGTRRPEPLATQSGNTSLLTGVEIDAFGAHQAPEILNRLPGVNIHRGSGGEHLTAIRSPVLTGGAGAGSFLFLEDGVPVRASGFANVNELFELNTEMADAIEVVRGPGSALYGSNAVHGLVNVLSRGPLSEPGGFVDISGGSFGRVIGRAFASIGSPENGATLALVAKHEDGYRSASGLDQQKLTLRRDMASGDITHRITLNAYNFNQETAGFVIGNDSYKDMTLARGNLNPEAYRDARAVRGAYRIERSADIGITEATLYGRWTSMNFAQHFLPSKATEYNGDWGAGFQASHQFELAGGSKLIFGLDGEYANGFLKEIQSRPSFGTNPQGTHYNYNVSQSVLAPYVHGEWRIDARALVTAGVRYEVTRYDYRTHTPADTIGQYQRPADRIDIFHAVTPKLGISYRLQPEIFVFGRLARGMRAPQVSDAYRLQSRQTVGEIKEEELDSAEIGLRGKIHGVSFEIDAYEMWKRHFFFRDADGFNVPDGKTRHRGVELEWNAPLPGRLELAGAWTYAEHTYDFNRPVTSAPTEVITSGNEVDTAPRWLGDLSLAWRPLDGMHAELVWSHIGKYFTDASNQHSYPGHDVLDLRMGWDVTEWIRVHAALRNLTNTNYAERADFAFGSGRYFPGETRGLEGGLEVRF